MKIESIIVTDGSWACSVSPSSMSSHSIWPWTRWASGHETEMMKIEAIIKSSKVDEVKAGLSAAGVEGITLTEVKGFGRQSGHTEDHRGAEDDGEFAPKMTLEIVVRNDQVQKVIEAIEVGATTGTVGDGKIFVLPLGAAIGNRMGEHDGNPI